MPSQPRIAILDYGMGNLHSVAKAVQQIAEQASVHIVADKQGLRQADRIIFPGVGAIRDCLLGLAQQNLLDTLQDCLQDKPVLGICVGMQALLAHSEENDGIECLNFFPGQIIRFRQEQLLQQAASNTRLKIPHMGWNQVQQSATDQARHALWHNIPDQSRFYFVHSYHAVNLPARQVIATTQYGETFPCAIAQGKVCAVQFHPEKSQRLGLQLLHNFVHRV